MSFISICEDLESAGIGFTGIESASDENVIRDAEKIKRIYYLGSIEKNDARWKRDCHEPGAK